MKLKIALWSIAFFIASTMTVTTSSTAISTTQAGNIQPEGPDPQSPDEIKAARDLIEREFSDAVDPDQLGLTTRKSLLRAYGHLDPQKAVPAQLLEEAVVYLSANESKFKNKNFLTVVDFGPRSDKYRFFLINLIDGSVEKYHTTHGEGSDVDNDGFAESFGNVPESRKSSLGYVRVAEVYSGAYNRSVRLDGLSSTNSNIRERAVVFHGWDGVKEENVIQGLSYGCITLDWDVKDGVLDKIKEGSLMYVGVSKKP